MEERSSVDMESVTSSDGSTLREQNLKEEDVIRLPGTVAEKPLPDDGKDNDTKGERGSRQGPVLEVTWDGPEDPENPKNWPTWKKWYTHKKKQLGILLTFIKVRYFDGIGGYPGCQFRDFDCYS